MATLDDFEIEDGVLIKYNGKKKRVIIPNNVTSIGDKAFWNCVSLTSIKIPSSVTSIGDFSFVCCASLISIKIPSSVTTIGDDAFFGCASLTSIIVDKDNHYYCSDNNILFNKYKTKIIRVSTNYNSYIIPNSVTTIDHNAFGYCESLTIIEIPNSVTTIGDWAFYSCSSLTSITIPNSVTSIGKWAFDGCKSLTSITIPNSVTSIGDWAFNWCEGLKTVYMSKKTKLGKDVFQGCSSDLKIIYTEDTEPQALEEDNNLYQDDYFDEEYYNNDTSQLVSNTEDENFSTLEKENSNSTVTNSDSQMLIEALEETLKHLGELKPFSNSLDSSELEIDKEEPSESSPIDDFKIQNNVLIQYVGKSSKVVIPNGITRIGYQSFFSNSILQSIVIPNTVKYIDKWAFYCCGGLKSISIPDSVVFIDDNAFHGCCNLNTVNISHKTHLGVGVFESCHHSFNMKYID